jgi:16S rRNA C967 or C1407 C5-methylase (RsmB/RsmF family)
MQFDRILCDVPCTGDGTLRKNVDLWAKWNPAMACGINPVQLAIASRAIDMLKGGGVK